MKTLGFILALTAVTASAEDSASGVAATAATPAAVTWQTEMGSALTPSAPAAILERQLDEVTRELDAALAERLAERAAARIAGDQLIVSADSLK